MQTAELIALAGAHGIDLRHLASSSLQGAAAKHRERVLAAVEELPKGRGFLGGRRPRLGADPAALAFNELPWHAARWSFADDCLSYWPLWWGLVFQTQRIARREDWPAQVRGARGEPQFYRDELAQLVLDAEANQPLFVAAPQLYGLCMAVEDRTWHEQLEPRYQRLRVCYVNWLEIGRSMIQRWVSEPLAPRQNLLEADDTGAQHVLDLARDLCGFPVLPGGLVGGHETGSLDDEILQPRVQMQQTRPVRRHRGAHGAPPMRRM